MFVCLVFFVPKGAQEEAEPLLFLPLTFLRLCCCRFCPPDGARLTFCLPCVQISGCIILGVSIYLKVNKNDNQVRAAARDRSSSAAPSQQSRDFSLSALPLALTAHQ